MTKTKLFFRKILVDFFWMELSRCCRNCWTNYTIEIWKKQTQYMEHAENVGKRMRLPYFWLMCIFLSNPRLTWTIVETISGVADWAWVISCHQKHQPLLRTTQQEMKISELDAYSCNLVLSLDKASLSSSMIHYRLQTQRYALNKPSTNCGGNCKRTSISHAETSKCVIAYHWAR